MTNLKALEHMTPTRSRSQFWPSTSCYIEKKRKEKEKITPVHDTGMNVSMLSKCLIHRAVL